jgi:hypothetical protein
VIAIPVAYFTSATVLTRATFYVAGAPSGGTVTIELNTAEDGSGSDIEVTIADGDYFATNTGSVAIAAGGYLYQRITDESGGAMSLSGNYEIESAVGATIFLTTLAHVKLDAKIEGVDADRDTVLTQLIQGVSRQIENHIGRSVLSSSTTGERVDGSGDNILTLHHYPIISISSLAENGNALVEDTDFEITDRDMARGQVARINGGVPMAWTSNTRGILTTYVHGYAAIPDDLVWAATALVVNRFNESAKGKGWRGLGGKGVDPSSSSAYDKEIWERDIMPVLAPYRRWVV